jgi:hypothetical protein
MYTLTLDEFKELNIPFSNIEKNFAAWKFDPEDRDACTKEA